MPIQLPALNTSGVDITNTVAKIDAMRTNDLQRKNLQSEIDRRNAQVPVYNAMKRLEMNKVQQEIDKNNLDEAARSTAWIANQPSESQEALWNDFRQTWEKKGVPLPSGDIYKADGVWNSERFKETSQAGIRARSLQLDPNIGRAEWIAVLNENFDPSKEESESNPRMVEKRYVSKGYGKIELDPTAPVKPKLGSVTESVKKRTFEEGRLEIADAREKALEDANRIREAGLIAAGEDRDKQRAVQERYWGAIATAALINADANKTKAEKTVLPGVKQIMKNTAGEMLRVMKDGGIEVLGLDEDGQPAWIPATAEQTKGVTGIGRPETESEKAAAALLSRVTNRGKTKPLTKAILDAYAATGKYKTKQEVLGAVEKDGYDTRRFK